LWRSKKQNVSIKQPTQAPTRWAFGLINDISAWLAPVQKLTEVA
jgi:hypothetical protein